MYGPYSPSRLETAECPLHFRAAYVDKLPEAKVETLPQARGKAIHTVLERITTARLSGQAIPRETIISMCAQAVNENPAAIQEMEVVIEAALAYQNNMPPIVTPENVIGVEYRVAMSAQYQEVDWKSPGVAFRFIVDIITGNPRTGELYVIDHKTQMHIDSRGDTFQMGFYAWGLKKMFPWATQIYTALHFCRAELNTYSKPYLWSDAELQRVENNVLARIEAIESCTKWPAIPNSKCQYCPLRPCKALEAMGRTASACGSVSDLAHRAVMMGDQSAARELAGMIHVDAEVRDTITTALQEYVKNNGPIAIPGKIFNYHVDEKKNWNYNKSMLFDTLKEHSFDPYMFFNADKKQLDRLRKKARPQLAEKLDACARMEKETKWGAK